MNCPQCGSAHVLDVTSFARIVDLAICEACGHEFAYDTETKQERRS